MRARDGPGGASDEKLKQTHARELAEQSSDGRQQQQPWRRRVPAPVCPGLGVDQESNQPQLLLTTSNNELLLLTRLILAPTTDDGGQEKVKLVKNDGDDVSLFQK